MNKNIKNTQEMKNTIIVSPSSHDVFLTDFSKEYERRYWVIGPDGEFKENKRKA